MITFGIDFDLIFHILDREISFEMNIEDNQVPEVSKYLDGSTITNETIDECVTLIPSTQVDREHSIIHVHVEGSNYLHLLMLRGSNRC